MATEVRRVPTAGGAKALKVLNNMIVSGLSVMGCEALVIASRNGIDVRVAAEHFRERGADSWPLVNQVIKHVLADELAPGRFSADYMAKDAALAASVARDHARPAWFASIAKVSFRGTSSLGLGDHYNPVAVRWFERATNTRQIQTFGPRAEQGGETLARLDLIAAAVRAHQALLSLDALSLLALEDLRPGEALAHLRAGSSDNAFFAELLADRGGFPRTTIASLAENLRDGIDLTSGGRGIALAWETSNNYAMSLLERFGSGVTLADIVDHLDRSGDRLTAERAAA